MSAVAPIEMPQGLELKITNNFHKDHEEMYNGDLIKIPAKGSVGSDGKPSNFIYMEYYKGIDFVGKYFPQKKLDSGEIISCKALSWDKVGSVDPNWKPTMFVCQVTGKSFTTQKEFEAHLKTLSDSYVPVKDETLDRAQDKSSALLNKMDTMLGAISKIADRVSALETRKKPGRKVKNDSSGNHHDSETGNE